MLHVYALIVMIMFDVVKPNGSVEPLVANSAVSSTLLMTILSWLTENCSMDDIIVRLRQRTVPSGYTIHTWIPGEWNEEWSCIYNYKLHVIVIHVRGNISYLNKCCTNAGKEETTVDMLRSILAQLEFTAIVRDYTKNGIPFDTHLHVPEVHEFTGDVILQREDEGHLFKV